MNNTLVFSLLGLIFLLDYFYSQSLYSYGIQLILYFQRSPNALVQYFLTLFTLLVDPIMVGLLTMATVVVSRRKAQAYAKVIFIVLNCILMTGLKTVYQSPRPTWTHPTVHNIGYYCPRDYGHPSGHSWFAPILPFVLLPSIFTPCIILVPLSRMYLGAHSLDQVILGLSIGLALTYAYCQGGLKQYILHTIQRNAITPIITKAAILLTINIIIYCINLSRDTSQHSAWSDQVYRKCGRTVDAEHINTLLLMFNCVLITFVTVFMCCNCLYAEENKIYSAGAWAVKEGKKNIVAYGGGQIALFASGALVFIPYIALNISKQYVWVFAHLAASLSAYFYNKYCFKVPLKLNNIELVHQQ